MLSLLANRSGFASAAPGRTPTASVSTSSLKPSRWTDASLYASPPKKTKNSLGRASPPVYFSGYGRRGNILAFRPGECTIKSSVSKDTNKLLQHAAPEFKTTGVGGILFPGTSVQP